MSRDIPFFEMFTELQLSGELRLKLAGAVLTGACIDQAALDLKLHLLVKLPLSEEDLAELRRVLQAVYGFSSVEIDVVCREEPPVPARGAPAGSGSRSAPSGGDGKGGKGGKVR